MNFKRIGISLAALFLSACASTVKYKPEITDECLIRDHQSVRFDETCEKQKFEQKQARVLQADAAALAKIEATEQANAMKILAASALREINSQTPDDAFSIKLLQALVNTNPTIRQLAEETATSLAINAEALEEHIKKIEDLRKTQRKLETCTWGDNAYVCTPEQAPAPPR